MIRITGGQWRGRGIESPFKSLDVRPTTSLVRESVFNRLTSVLEGSRFLDLFAGSGIMGLEALSRGAGFVMAVEKNPQQIRVLRRNAEALGTSESQYRLLQKNVLGLVQKPNPDAPFDIVFMDPPYGAVDLPLIVQSLGPGEWLASGGIILVEHGQREPDLVGFERKRFGNTSLSWLRLD